MTDERASAVATRPEDDAVASEEVQRALEDLRREIRTRFPVPRPDASPAVSRPSSVLAATLASTDWEALLERLRRRLGSLGMSERSVEIDEFGMDEGLLQQLRPLLDWLLDRYWRLQLRGLEHLPDRGPGLLVANRSGLLPYDGLVLSHAIARSHPSGERPRFLVADWLMHQPFVHATVAQVGGVRACTENAARLLASKRFVVVFPEGAKGAAKPFRERYQLKRFGRGGAVRLALTQGVPLIPVGIVGAEEIHPILFKIGASARSVGLPFVPVTPTFPLLGPLGLLPLPTKWVIEIGEPFALDSLGPESAQDALLVARLNEELRGRIQALVYRAIHERDSVWG